MLKEDELKRTKLSIILILYANEIVNGKEGVMDFVTIIRLVTEKLSILSNKELDELRVKIKNNKSECSKLLFPSSLSGID